jgi:hypothetical protein
LGVAFVVGLLAFGLLLRDSLRYADRKLGPRLLHIEEGGPR